MKKQKIIIITGNRGSGKTALAYEYIDLLKRKDIKIGGVITKSDDTKRYENKFLYSVVDILTNEEKELLTSVKPTEKSIKVGRFYMNLDALSWANEKITAASKICNALLIDELGPAELQGFGYARIAKELVNRYKGLIVFIVRIEILEQMRLFLHCNPENTIIVNAENSNKSNNQFIYKVLTNE